jgi:hypothetical protein
VDPLPPVKGGGEVFTGLQISMQMSTVQKPAGAWPEGHIPVGGEKTPPGMQSGLYGEHSCAATVPAIPLSAIAAAARAVHKAAIRCHFAKPNPFFQFTRSLRFMAPCPVFR